MSNIPMTTRTGFGAALSPTEQANFIISRLQRPSAFLRSGVLQYRTVSETYAIPRSGEAMPPPQWVEEGAPLPEAEVEGDALVLRLHKLGIVVPMSRELYESSSPDAMNAVGDALSRALAKTLDDTAFTGDAGAGWDGLAADTEIATVAYAAGDLDSFKTAQGMVLGAGGMSMVTVMGPAAYTSLSLLKVGADQNEHLLTGIPNDGSVSHEVGTEIYTASSLDQEGDAYVYDPACLGIVWRETADIRTSDQERFSSDQIVVRATLRAAFFVGDPAGVVRITGLPTAMPTPGNGPQQAQAQAHQERHQAPSSAPAKARTSSTS